MSEPNFIDPEVQRYLEMGEGERMAEAASKYSRWPFGQDADSTPLDAHNTTVFRTVSVESDLTPEQQAAGSTRQ